MFVQVIVIIIVDIKQQDLLVIGGGISSLLTVFYSLPFLEHHPIKRINIIDGSDYCPSASLSSSAVAALRGAQYSINPSDYTRDLMSAFQNLQDFYQQFKSCDLGMASATLIDQD